MMRLWFNANGIIHDGSGLILCDTCPCDQSSSGSESGSFVDSSSMASDSCTSSTCVEVPCCPGNPIPLALTAVITGGSCAGTYSMDWDGTHWISGDFPYLLEMTCETFGWYMTAAASADAPTSESCSPFELQFSFLSDPLCGDFIVTITG